jgi:hypothetical protein
MTKNRVNITISPDTKEQLLQYGYENHISGGLSGVIEYIAWNEIKVKNAQPRGQMSIFNETSKKGAKKNEPRAKKTGRGTPTKG